MMNYYIDTYIWIDFIDKRGVFGKYAFELFRAILTNNNQIIITNILINELQVRYTKDEINSMFTLFNTKFIKETVEELEEAKSLSIERNLPKGDVLHAIIARNHGLIFVSRDKHFLEMRDIITYHLPGHII